MIEETCLPRAIHLRIEEVFAPIFFEYPHGLKDRSVWVLRDTNQYILHWYELASMRECMTAEHGNELSKAQTKEIFQRYMEDMLDTAIAFDFQILYAPWYLCIGKIWRMSRYA